MINKNFLLSKVNSKVEDYKRRLQERVYQLIYDAIPVDTGNLRDTLTVEWRGNQLYASTEAYYGKFVRLGYVSKIGNIVAGRDYYAIDIDLLRQEVRI